MARASRSKALYTGDPHTQFTETNFVMLIPDAEIADATRGWGAPAGGESLMPRRMKPRHVIGRDPSGNGGRAIVADTAADLWTGVAATFDVNGVTYTVTGFVGEKRTV